MSFDENRAKRIISLPCKAGTGAIHASFVRPRRKYGSVSSPRSKIADTCSRRGRGGFFQSSNNKPKDIYRAQQRAAVIIISIIMRPKRIRVSLCAPSVLERTELLRRWFGLQCAPLRTARPFIKHKNTRDIGVSDDFSSSRCSYRSVGWICTKRAYEMNRKIGPKAKNAGPFSLLAFTIEKSKILPGAYRLFAYFKDPFQHRQHRP